jgi:geranylgeranyl pyrophosphate synthase
VSRNVPQDGWDVFAPALDRVSALLDELLDASPAVARDARRLVQTGKRLRARLLFAAADGGSRRDENDLVRCAAAIELVHSASLLHDDIVDRAVERRGFETLHQVRGARVAALVGISLAHLAIELISNLPQPIRVRFAGAGRDAARGQFAELTRLRDVHLGPEERISVMELKTASVFALACELGGLVARRKPRDVVRLRTIGTAFGVLFQIADDLDDLFATAKELGRAPGSDLREGVVSLPLAYVLQTDVGDELRGLLVRDRGMPAVRRCRELVVRSGALELSADVAHRHLAIARRSSRLLPVTEGSRWMMRLLDTTAARIDRHTARTHMRTIDRLEPCVIDTML